MADYKVIITNNGLDRLEAAMANGESLVVAEMGFGDAFGEEYIPSPNQQDLKHKLFSKPLVEAILSEGTVRYKSTLLSSDPAGDFLELGLYLDDGSLFAVSNIPKLEHRHSDSGAVTETDVTMIMVAENAENVTISVSSELYVSKDYANTYYLRTDGTNSPSKDISMANNALTNVKAGIYETDASNISQLLPIGSVYLYAGVDAPENSKECDGLSYSRLGEMSSLYAKIGTLYGKGEGNMTFNVPKLDPPDPNNPTIRYMIKYRY